MKSGVPAGHSAFWLIGVALISDVQERPDGRYHLSLRLLRRNGGRKTAHVGP